MVGSGGESVSSGRPPAQAAGGAVAAFPEAAAQVDRIRASGALGRRSRAPELLAYLLRAALDPAAGPVSEYAIAIEVLGRGPEFDPASDSIARVELGRLRRALEGYYAGPGRDDPLILEIPRGQYDLVLRRAAAAEGPAGAPAPGSAAPAGRAGPGRHRGDARQLGLGWFRLALSTLGLVLVGLVPVALGVMLWQGEGGALPGLRLDRPELALRGFGFEANDDEARRVADAVERQLLRELSRVPTLRLLDREAEDAAFGTRANDMPDYLLEGSVVRGGGGVLDPEARPEEAMEIDFRLIATADWTVLLDRSVPIDMLVPDRAAAVRRAVREQIALIASPGGAIPRALIRRMRETPGLMPEGRPERDGFACLLVWYAYDLEKSGADGAVARRCLAARIEAGSANSALWAAYSFLQFLDWTRSGTGPDDPALDAAYRSAVRAVQLDPLDAQAHEYLGSILLAKGQRGNALEQFRRAQEIDPAKPDLYVHIGWLKALDGDWEAAVHDIDDGIARAPSVPGWFRIPLSLDAFRRGDDRRALAEAEAIVASGDMRGHVLALAAALRAGEVAAAEKHRARLAEAGQSAGAALEEIRAVFDDPPLIAAYRAVLGG